MKPSQSEWIATVRCPQSQSFRRRTLRSQPQPSQLHYISRVWWSRLSPPQRSHPTTKVRRRRLSPPQRRPMHTTVTRVQRKREEPPLFCLPLQPAPMQSSGPRRTRLRQLSTRGFWPKCLPPKRRPQECRPLECRPLECPPLKCSPWKCQPTPILVNTTINHKRRSLQFQRQLIRPPLHLSQSPRTLRLPPSAAWGVVDLTLFEPPNILRVRTECSNFAFPLNSACN
mmetsp:Transcript_66022/g.174981  ORF Transcript_66022/g.174981 Transcript_66022/m.174981 type:complete len:227 (-) Transcript_66022:2083-2763(-)